MRCILLKCDALKNSCIYISQSHHHTGGSILLCHSGPVYPQSLRSVAQLPCPARLRPHPGPRFLRGKPGELGLQRELSCSPSAWKPRMFRVDLLVALGPSASGKGRSFSTIFPTALTSGLFLKCPVKATGMCWGGDGHLLRCLR